MLIIESFGFHPELKYECSSLLVTTAFHFFAQLIEGEARAQSTN